jgi:hypothetical protein
VRQGCLWQKWCRWGKYRGSMDDPLRVSGSQGGIRWNSLIAPPFPESCDTITGVSGAAIERTKVTLIF